MYYDNKLYVEETDEQRTMRLAKEKAKKRNNTIDQILGK
jgi:uridine kinase